MRDQPPLPLPVLDENTEASGHDQEQGLCILAVALEFGSTRQPEPVRFGEHPPQRRIADILQERKIAQPRAQGVRIDRFLTDAE